MTISHKTVLIRGRREGTYASALLPVTHPSSSVPNKVFSFSFFFSCLSLHAPLRCLCSYADLYFHLGLLKMVALLTFFVIWVSMDGASGSLFKLWMFNCLVSENTFFHWGGGCGGDVDVLIFKILCFACVPFCFALVLSHHRIVWSGCLLFGKKKILVSSLYFDYSDSVLFIAFSALICIWIQEWKRNWIFFSRVCQVTTIWICHSSAS